MIGLDYILASQMMLADYKVKCELKAAPEITVSATGLDTVFDNSKYIHELDGFKPSVNSNPYGDKADTHIEGLTRGMIGLTGSYDFTSETYPALNKVCMYIKDVQVKISVEPTVYIAHEFPKGSCRYEAVMGHERKHLKVDRDIVNKYSTIIVRAVNNTLTKVGYAQGPYDSSQLPALQKQIGGIIDSVIGQYYVNMNNERKVLQSQVDTLEEYARVDALCPNEPQPKM